MSEGSPEFTPEHVPDGTVPPLDNGDMPEEEGDAGLPDPEPFEED